MSRQPSAISLVLSLLLLNGCGGIMDDLRRDSYYAENAGKLKQRNLAALEDPIRRRTVQGLSANNTNQFKPNVRRQYDRARRGLSSKYTPPKLDDRLTADDFVDNDFTENSLWNPQGQKNFLFTQNKERAPGDLLLVAVDRNLRREIQYQLWLTLPPEQRRRRKKRPPPKDDKEASQQANQQQEDDRDAAAEEAQRSLASGPEDDYLKSEIVENEGNGLIRLLGHKRVIYRGRRRTVEVVALARDRDIDNNDMMKAEKFIDAKVRVIR